MFASKNIMQLDNHRKNIFFLVDEIKKKPYTTRPIIRLKTEINTYNRVLKKIRKNTSNDLEQELSFNINDKVYNILKKNNLNYLYPINDLEIFDEIYLSKNILPPTSPKMERFNNSFQQKIDNGIIENNIIKFDNSLYDNDIENNIKYVEEELKINKSNKSKYLTTATLSVIGTALIISNPIGINIGIGVGIVSLASAGITMLKK